MEGTELKKKIRAELKECSTDVERNESYHGTESYDEFDHGLCTGWKEALEWVLKRMEEK